MLKPVAALTLVAQLAGCGLATSTADDGVGHIADLPNILIVELDACRADKLGCYGFDRETSPTIDALAADPDAVLFRRHYVQGAFTKSSTASLFTGMYVFQHGVVLGHLVQENPSRSGIYPVQVLDGRFETVAERLSDAGYATFGAVKSRHLLDLYGFAQGFDEYRPPSQAPGDGARIRATLDMIRDASAPFFGYLHLSACHHPFKELQRDEAYMTRYGIDYDEPARRKQGIDFTRSRILHDINGGKTTLTPDDVAFLNLIYEAKVRRVDEVLVKALIDGLREAGVYDDTLIILTADHGEELYDHGGYGHGHALWDEVVHVPLIVKFPRDRKPPGLGRVVDRVTQSIDLLPSLLTLAGQPADDALPGTDIFWGTPRDMAYCETPTAWMLVQGDFKLIRGDHGGLFNLAGDPGERRNLAATDAAQLTSMQTAANALTRLLAADASDAPVIEDQLDQRTVDALRSLGYLR